MHVVGAVARARKTIAQAEIGFWRLPDQPRERLNLRNGEPGDPGCPFRCLRDQMLLKPRRIIRILTEIVPIGKTLAEQHMHHSASQRTISTGADDVFVVRLLHRAGVINIDTSHLRPTRFPRHADMRHHVDLRIDRIATPNNDKIRLLHLPWIYTRNATRSRKISGPTQRDAERAIHTGIGFGIGQPLNAVAHDQAHGARVVIGPDRLGTMFGFNGEKTPGNVRHRLIPRHTFKLPRPFRAYPLHGVKQTLRMVNALGIARNLFADHTQCIGIVLVAAHPANGVVVEKFDIERASGRAIMRAD